MNSTPSPSRRLHYLTIDEVAAQLRVGRRQVLKWITCGVLPAHKFGRLWRVDADELDAFIAASRFPRESA